MSPKVARYVTEYFQCAGQRQGNKEDAILTDREQEIVKHAAEGLTCNEIAKILFISPHTARTHIRNIYEKLHVHSIEESFDSALYIQEKIIKSCFI